MLVNSMKRIWLVKYRHEYMGRNVGLARKSCNILRQFKFIKFNVDIGVIKTYLKMLSDTGMSRFLLLEYNRLVEKTWGNVSANTTFICLLDKKMSSLEVLQMTKHGKLIPTKDENMLANIHRSNLKAVLGNINIFVGKKWRKTGVALKTLIAVTSITWCAVQILSTNTDRINCRNHQR